MSHVLLVPCPAPPRWHELLELCPSNVALVEDESPLGEGEVYFHLYVPNESSRAVEVSLADEVVKLSLPRFVSRRDVALWLELTRAFAQLCRTSVETEDGELRRSNGPTVTASWSAPFPRKSGKKCFGAPTRSSWT